MAAVLLAPISTEARTIVANPSAVSGQDGYYRTLAKALTPGDTLVLPAGVYGDRLSLSGLHGNAEAWIVVTGPTSGPPATITTNSTCCNTVQLDGTSFVALRHLTIDSAGLDAIDGINAKGNPTHDILIENCTLIGQDASQGTVGISTKSPAWGWTIRGNRIIQAGTGIYLGNSDGSQPFIAGVIENNLFLNTIGYNMEVKPQNPYDGKAWVSDIPKGPNRTIIRNNVFIKEKNDWDPSKIAGVRPNLLVDPFPTSGVGSSDLYEIYGNFFYKNPSEVLFQGSGRFTLHDNVFVASASGQSSAYFTDHNGPLKLAHVYNNTVYSQAGRGFTFAAMPREAGIVCGNLIVTAGTALGGTVPKAANNVTGTPTNGTKYFSSPSEVLGQMDFYPATGCARCRGAALDMRPFTNQTASGRDFNGVSKGGFSYRGAYAGRGANPGWRLAADAKPAGPAGGRASANPPNPPKPPQSIRSGK